jgi:hypothetical protein
MPRPGLYPREKEPVPITHEAEGLQDLCGLLRKISPPTGIRSSDHSTRSESRKFVVPTRNTFLVCEVGNKRSVNYMLLFVILS